MKSTRENVNTNVQENGTNTHEWKSPGTLANEQDIFVLFSKWKRRETSSFQELPTKVWDQYTLSKADKEMFSFWLNGIFAKQ